MAWNRTTADDLLRALAALEAQWQRFDAPIAGVLEPGISPEEIELLAAPYGLTIPTELQVLWGWHNGASTLQPSGISAGVGPGNYEFLSVQASLDSYVFNRSVHGEPDDPDLLPDRYWHESWLPFMKLDARRLYVDCNRTDQFGASPVRLVTWEWENPDVDRASSLAQLIRTWTWLLEQDLYRLVRSESGWAAWEPIDWPQIPEFIRFSGLA